MRLKKGVILSLSASMARALPGIEVCVEKVTERELVITSASDGAHRLGSRHYTGEAIDIRTMYLDAHGKDVLRAALASVLGVSFDVVVEADHIHIEYDPD